MNYIIAAYVTIVLLSGCAFKNYGDEEFKLQIASHGKDVMWFPTKVEMTDEMFKMAKIRQGDLIYDLGSGDGVIPIEAAKKYGVRAVGIEYNADLVALSNRNAERAKVTNLVTFRQGDIFKEDFSQATVLTLYLGDNLNVKLKPQILKMKAGTRVLSNTFRMESWIPDQEIKVSSGEMAYLWIVPAQIDGNWEFSGIPNIENAKVRILQKKQFFEGSIYEKNLLRSNFDIGRINGETLEFEFVNAASKYVFKGRITGSEIIGILNNDSNMRVIGRRVPP
jgi:precorrin-6B methylase 2